MLLTTIEVALGKCTCETEYLPLMAVPNIHPNKSATIILNGPFQQIDVDNKK